MKPRSLMGGWRDPLQDTASDLFRDLGTGSLDHPWRNRKIRAPRVPGLVETVLQGTPATRLVARS